MFVQTWNKYLPVIKILLKRSLKEEQTLEMNKSDFERAAGGKKVKFTFSFELIEGRQKPIENLPPVAKELVSALQQDNAINKFIKKSELEFTMNGNFQLLIKNATPPVEPDPQTEDEVTEPGKQASDDSTL